MFLKTLTFLFFLNVFNINAQEKEILPIPEIKAEPIQGMRNFYATFIRNVNLSEMPEEKNSIRVRLVFFVETDGSFSDIIAEGEPVKIQKEVIRVMQLMPNWKPAITKGKPLRSKFYLSITIKGANETALEK